MKAAYFFGVALALGLTTACGSSAVPAPAVTEARSTISAAEAVGAENEPKARLHLKMARDQTALAEAAMRDGENEDARLLLERARVDAELALVLTREAQARALAQQSLNKVQELQRQN